MRLQQANRTAGDVGVLEFMLGDTMVALESGDFVKFEIKNEKTGDSEWMWLRVERSDEAQRLVFGWLDSQPVAFTADLKLGQHMAVSYDNVREHRKSSEFQNTRSK
jgi:hypothetical protein